MDISSDSDDDDDSSLSSIDYSNISTPDSSSSDSSGTPSYKALSSSGTLRSNVEFLIGFDQSTLTGRI